MTIGWEPRKLAGANGWGLKALHTGRFRVDDDGNPLVFRTKREADKARRELEADLRGGRVMKREDVHAERVTRERLTRRKRKPIIETSAGPKTPREKDHGY